MEEAAKVFKTADAPARTWMDEADKADMHGVARIVKFLLNYL